MWPLGDKSKKSVGDLISELIDLKIKEAFTDPPIEDNAQRMMNKIREQQVFIDMERRIRHLQDSNDRLIGIINNLSKGEKECGL